MTESLVGWVVLISLLLSVGFGLIIVFFHRDNEKRAIHFETSLNRIRHYLSHMKEGRKK